MVATAPRPERIIVLRPYYFHGGTGNTGGIGNSSTRAAREVKKVQVAAICGAEYQVRQGAAANAIAAAGAAPAPGTIFVGTTEDGFDERWMVASNISSAVRVGLLDSDCPNGGGP